MQKSLRCKDSRLGFGILILFGIILARERIRHEVYVFVRVYDCEIVRGGVCNTPYVPRRFEVAVHAAAPFFGLCFYLFRGERRFAV